MCARVRLIIFVLCFIACSTVRANDQANKNTDGLSIVVNSVDVNDKALKLQYE